MPPAITRSSVSSRVTCSSPFVTMRSESCLHVSGMAYLIHPRLNKLLGDVVISQGGVVPFILPELLPSKSNKSKKEGGASQEV